MRTAVLFALAILTLPIFACLPAGMVHAVELVNINTANAELLDTLPNIGPALATRIIDYRTTQGLFSSIQDLQKVTGIGSGVTYAEIAPLITVGEISAPSNTTSTSTTALPTQSISSSSTDTETYTTPSTFLIKIIGNQNAILGVPLHLSARATTKNGAIDTSAQISWGLGDGSSAIGSVIEKTYRYVGTYLIVVNANNGTATAHDEIVVTVKPSEVRISAISSDGITIKNDANERLDLSGWRLISISNSFRFPEGTVLLPNASVLFPYTVMNWQVTFNAYLTYPDGVIASQYVPNTTPVIATSTPISDTKLSTPKISFNKVQTANLDEVQARQVEPIISTKTNIQENEEAVGAPAEAIELAAAGAVLPSVSKTSASENNFLASGIFHSTWTLGLLGVIILAGGAFILL